ncbi:replication-associated recombination protein A [bacterium]|nr:replication-associated recombination protein A [bacterium]MCG2675883.1 replication-associated recombination protein A [bacterium]
MDLFEEKGNKKIFEEAPLALRMRPKDLSEFVGQEHILSKGKLLYRAIEADRINSAIFWGPPGTGKSALAHVVAQKTESHFEYLNATTCGVGEIRKVVAQARNRRAMYEKKTTLFIDEIHRFNKAQQDTLLPHVEEGVIILIGATIHNPYFSVIKALLSRSLVFEFKPLKKKDVEKIVRRALKEGLEGYQVRMGKEALKHLATYCDGDARKALNALELGVMTTKPGKEEIIDFNLDVAQESIQKKALRYDRGEDEHYDTISALIKSMRGSDPDATLYWLAKMIAAGEDPRFIARRIVICASEDVGNADPQALVLAQAAFGAAEAIGLPEARIPLAQAAVYVATAPKSNACYLGIEKALKDVEERRTLQVPKYLKDTHYPGAEKLGYGKGYKYAHEYEKGYVKQKYLPTKVRYYEPKNIGYETKIKARLEEWERIVSGEGILKKEDIKEKE